MGLFSFRPGCPSDAGEMLEIRRLAMEGTLPQAYSTEFIVDVIGGVSEDDIRRFMSEGEVFEIAISDGMGVGYCGTKGMRIESLFVRPDHMRKGIGSALLKRAELVIASTSHKKIELSAIIVSIDFYRKHGYSDVGRVMQRTRTGMEGAVQLMERSLISDA